MNETLTTGASRSISNYNSDDILNIARLAWQLSGNAEFQKKQYGSDSIDMFSGNRAGMMKTAQDYLNGVTTRVPEIDTALDKAVQQHFGSKVVAPATGAGGEQYVYGMGALDKKANDAAVRTLYKSYFNRDPSGAELKNWGDKGGKDTTVKALETFLKAERVKYNITTDIKPIAESKGGTGTAPAPSPTTPSTPTQPNNFTDTSTLPDRIKNDPAFKALSPDNQALASFQWNAMQAQDALTKIRAKQALEEATKLAEPAFKQSLLLAKDEVERSLATLLSTNKTALDKLNIDLANAKQDFITKHDRLNAAEQEAKLKDIESITTIKDQAVRESSSREAGVAADLARTQRRIDALSQDLKTGKQDISLEEQATLGRQLQEYQRNLQTTQENAVDAGLGFSSIRTQAEQRLSEDLQYVTESTQRQANRQQRLLETQTSRDTTELVASEVEINRKNQEDRVAMARQIEQKTGFSSIPQVLIDKIKSVDPAFAPTGIRGDLNAQQQQRETDLAQQQQDIETARKRAEASTLAQQQALEKEREQKVLAIERANEKAVGTANLTPTDIATTPPIGNIQGTLVDQQAKNIQAIQESILKTSPSF